MKKALHCRFLPSCHFLPSLPFFQWKSLIQGADRIALSQGAADHIRRHSPSKPCGGQAGMRGVEARVAEGSPAAAGRIEAM